MFCAEVSYTFPAKPVDRPATKHKMMARYGFGRMPINRSKPPLTAP